MRREIPVGSLVVTKIRVRVPGRVTPHPAGTSAWVRKAPDAVEARYRLQFADGSICDVDGEFLRLLAELRPGDEAYVAEEDLASYVILQCVVGGRAHGLAEDGTEDEVRGIYLPPAQLHWAYGGVPEKLEDPDGRQVTWELQRFLTLALGAEPEALECLYTPLVEHSSPIADELLAERSRFLTVRVRETFLAEIDARFEKIRKQLRVCAEVDWRNATEIVRLLLAGIGVAEEGTLAVHAGKNRDALIAIRRGEMDWPQVDRWRLMLRRRFDDAWERASLPQGVDLAWVSAFLVHARRRMARMD